VVGRLLMGRRVLVCGGRDFNDSDKLFEVLDQEHARNPFDLVITGGAKGADWWGHYWAIKRGVPYKVFPADWMTYGEAAGPVRDQQIIDEGRPDVVIAFPGGTGTDEVINRAGLAEVPVVRVN
jgi:YspA, cpYpsA-related SLOG family